MLVKNMGRTVLALVTLSLLGCGEEWESRAPAPLAEEKTDSDVTGKPQASARDARLSTVRDGSGYRVSVDGVERAWVPIRALSSTLFSAVSPDGSTAALIPDHDTHHGPSLLLLDVVSGALRTYFEGPVTSAVFSRQGTRLAYAVATRDGASVRLGTTTSLGRPLGELRGRKVELLGFSSDGRSLFAVVYPDRQDDGAYAASLVRMSTATGEATAILGSGLVSSERYSDIRLVRVNGEDRVSYIRSGHQLCIGDSELRLATTDGYVVQSFRPTTGELYRAAAWSPDGSQVAYAVQACPNKTAIVANREAAAAEQARGTGVFVADVAGGKATRVVDGIPSADLLGVEGGVLRFGSEREGVATLDSAPIRAGTESELRASSLLKPEADAQSLIQGLTNRAIQINQVYDTRDNFDGRGSCGPTSAVMTMASYQLSEWGIWVNYGGNHYSPYGRYLTDSYSYNGTTFSYTEPDYSGAGAWAGAHGWVYSACCGAVWADLLSYLNRHTGWAQQHGWDETWIKGELNRGQLVAASGGMTSAGHIILIKGYTTDGKWIVNDPFGVNTSGGPGGGDQTYTTAYIRPSQVWSN
ncbi:C39 family peptidase [Pyxidicoccus parkwayensis]|uniref:C39 family peptidase n=1 Tax=Pyxidicoccus parkwayensis TaxID=2813578 RepID=A0ABX7P8B7_9BACT|nr:C39 family peptidase [Pyxidicoccus parkwaysis]QSQ26655.1 C39 family peptidase [Pyxidicoccus parkwaysis]